MIFYIFIYFFTSFFLFFIIKFLFLIFSFLFWQVSNLCNKILTNQEQELELPVWLYVNQRNKNLPLCPGNQVRSWASGQIFAKHFCQFNCKAFCVTRKRNQLFRSMVVLVILIFDEVVVTFPFP